MISLFESFWTWIPFKYNILLSFPPPVIPISVCAASPGPFTTHPIIDSVIGVLMWDNLLSRILTVSITSKPWRAHEGHEIILTPLFLKFKDLSIWDPIDDYLPDIFDIISYDITDKYSNKTQKFHILLNFNLDIPCLLYTSPSPRD